MLKIGKGCKYCSNICRVSIFFKKLFILLKIRKKFYENVLIYICFFILVIDLVFRIFILLVWMMLLVLLCMYLRI